MKKAAVGAAKTMVIWGVNPVLEALRRGRVRRLSVGPRDDRRMDALLGLARERGVAIDRVDAHALDRASRGGAHQGVVAELEPSRDFSIQEMLAAAAPEAPLVIVLDNVVDPHNVGAILRTADAAGVHGVVRQARHAASLDGIVAKASAGALAHVRIATVVNIARTIDELKAAGVWTVGLAVEAAARYDEVDLTLPTAFVLGAEGSGLRRLVRERCDRLVSIPTCGTVGSLNVSVAAGVALFEAVRQRNRARRV